MHLNDAIESLANFIETLELDNKPIEGLFRDRTVLINRGDHTVILTGDDADRYSGIAQAIYTAVSARRPMSRSAITDLVDNYLLRVLKSGDHRENSSIRELLAAEMKDLKRKLFEKTKRWKVHLTVEGLAPSGLPQLVGNSNFELYEETQIAELKTRLLQVRAQSGAAVNEAVEAQMQADLDTLKGKAVATISVSAVDQAAAIEIARRNLQITIDTINFYASREKLGGWAFLPGDSSSQAELQIAISDAGDLHAGYRRAGPIRKIPLNQLAGRPGFKRVSDILSKEERSDLEERILASFQWAGRAQVEQRRDEAFLLYAIALESLLLGRDIKTELSYQLGLRCAHLGGGPAIEDRRLVLEQIASLYNVRSATVHSGSFAVSEADLELIRQYTLVSLFI